jgi:hypothetical protein
MTYLQSIDSKIYGKIADDTFMSSRFQYDKVIEDQPDSAKMIFAEMAKRRQLMQAIKKNKMALSRNHRTERKIQESAHSKIYFQVRELRLRQNYARYFESLNIFPQEYMSVNEFARHYLQNLPKYLSAGWDSYDAEIPDERAVHKAILIVENLEYLDIEIKDILPTVEGGYFIELPQKEGDCRFEIYNSGDEIFLCENSAGIQVYDLIETDIMHCIAIYLNVD